MFLYNQNIIFNNKLPNYRLYYLLGFIDGVTFSLVTFYMYQSISKMLKN